MELIESRKNLFLKLCIIDKRAFFLNFIICAMYLAAFQRIIRGVLRKLDPDIETLFHVLVTAFLYVSPMFLAWFGKLNKRFGVFLLLFGYIIIIYPAVKYNELYLYLNTTRVFILIFFYIPIVGYLLLRENRFEAIVKKHFVLIAIIYALICYLETFSFMYPNPIGAFYKSMGPPPWNVMSSRSLGGLLDFHTQGAVLVLASLIVLFWRRYFLCGFLVGALFLSGARTWFISFACSFFVYIIFYKKEPLRNRLIPVLMVVIVAMVFREYVMMNLKFILLSPEKGSMIYYDQLGSAAFIQQSLMPHGFYVNYSQYFGTTQAYASDMVIHNEISFLYLMYSMGPIGVAIWMYLLYKPILPFKSFLTFKVKKIFNNDNNIILFASVFGLFHSLNIHVVFIVILLLTCSLSSDLQQKNYHLIEAVD